MYSRVDIVSDWEEDANGSRKAIIPAWRSDQLTELTRLVDEITYKVAMKSQEIRQLHSLLDRTANIALPSKFSLPDCPKKLPLDSYQPEVLAQLSEIELQLVAPGPDGKIQEAINYLAEKMKNNTGNNRRVVVPTPKASGSAH